jgi:hypothetical protein
MKLRLAFAALLAVGFFTGLLVADAPARVEAQEESSSSEMSNVAKLLLMQSRMESTRMIGALADEHIPAALAKHKRLYYDALLNEGFDPDEALQIVAGDSTFSFVMGSPKD